MVKTNPITGELDRLSQDFYKNAFVDPAMTETKTFRGFANLAQKAEKVQLLANQKNFRIFC